MDAADDPSRVDALERRASDLGLAFLRISGATGEGLPALLEAMWQRLAAAPEKPTADTHIETSLREVPAHP